MTVLPRTLKTASKAPSYTIRLSPYKSLGTAEIQKLLSRFCNFKDLGKGGRVGALVRVIKSITEVIEPRSCYRSLRVACAKLWIAAKLSNANQILLFYLAVDWCHTPNLQPHLITLASDAHFSIGIIKPGAGWLLR